VDECKSLANGHRITDMSGEAFVVRLFRSGNRRGFVRALTDRPGDLTRGLGAIERAMKALMVGRCRLAVSTPELKAHMVSVLEATI
jgi:DNA excision repair protein ERCC-4